MDGQDIFDRTARRLRRDRAARAGHDGWLRQIMTEGVLDRLSMVRRGFADTLDLGCCDGTLDLPGRVLRIDAGAVFASQAEGLQADEDRLPVAPASLDLIVSVGVLDAVNDVPGALALIRRALRPDGLFLAALVGAGTLATLKSVLLAAEERPAARIHPQIDVRAAGDLLVRAGFALPVADGEMLTVRYPDLFRLLCDLRAMAGTNVLRTRPALGRATLARAAAAFAARADADGKTAEQVHILYLTGWAPSPDQPQPARRGSATASLATALSGQRDQAPSDRTS